MIEGWRGWLAAFVLWPRRVSRGIYWLVVEPLPGDRFWDVRRDRYGEYIGGGKIAVASAAMVMGKDWFWNLPPGATPAIERWDVRAGWQHV